MSTALAKSRVAWLLVPPDTTVPCWYAATGDTAYVVGGEGEQAIPELPSDIRIILRDKETRRPIGPLPVHVSRVWPDSAGWEEATTALLAVRQNTPAGDRRAYWAEHCAVWSLGVVTSPPATPEPAQSPDPAADHAAPPTTESATPD